MKPAICLHLFPTAPSPIRMFNLGAGTKTSLANAAASRRGGVPRLRTTPDPRACPESPIRPQAGWLGLKLAPDVRSFFDQSEAFVDPTGCAPNHLFHRTPELRESDRSFVRSVAVRPCAVDDKYRFRRILLHSILSDRQQRDIDRTGNMAFAVGLAPPNVEEHEVNRVRSEGRIHIGAIGLKCELPGKVLECR